MLNKTALRIINLMRRVIQWQTQVFLGERNLIFSCHCNKEQIVSLIKDRILEPRGLSIIGKGKLRRRFKGSLTDNRLVLKRQFGLMGSSRYHFIGRIEEDGSKSYIRGSYKLLPFERAYCLIWVNLNLAFLGLMVVIFITDIARGVIFGFDASALQRDGVLIAASVLVSFFSILILKFILYPSGIKALTSTMSSLNMSRIE